VSQTADWDDPEVAAAWVAEQREAVVAYLESQKIRVEGLPAEPAWTLPPKLAFWCLGSASRPATWVISGDVPTDYLSDPAIRTARAAAAAFGRRWERVAANMRAGRKDPELTIGRPEDQKKLGALLAKRASLLKDFADRADYWP
jgi:hypothetical protein